MDELKKLLRRLDGLDGDRGLAKNGPLTVGDQQGYVGALRGAPVPREGEDGVASLGLVEASLAKPQPPPPAKASGAAIYIAAATAALVSTVVVFLLMSWQRAENERRYVPLPSQNGATTPNKLEQQPAAGGASGQGRVTDTADVLVRRADMLIGSGEIEAARALLQRAAELGSGNAALKLGRSYDPAQSRELNFADSQTNPALAKAWYERALALGTREAAAYLSQPYGK